jgi:hypothetical protein
MMHVRKVLTKKEKQEYEDWKKKNKPKKMSAKNKEIINQQFWSNYNKVMTRGIQDQPVIKSHNSAYMEPCTKSSIMDPMNLAKESVQTRIEILDKSQRLAPHYSKGPVQYISKETDLKTLGKKV